MQQRILLRPIPKKIIIFSHIDMASLYRKTYFRRATIKSHNRFRISENHAPYKGNSVLSREELEAKEKALELLEKEKMEKESIDLFLDRYSKETEGRIIYIELSKQKILKSDFEASYLGWFRSMEEFAFFKLHGSNGLCKDHNVNYKEYAEEIFKEEFVFVEGHVFWQS